MIPKPFFVDEQARHALQLLSRESGYREPVAIISETADVTSNFGLDTLAAEFVAGTGSKEQLASIARQKLAEREGSLNFRMQIEVRDRESVSSEAIERVSGFLFVMTPHLLGLLSGYHLTCEGQRFSIRDDSHIERTLRSIVSKDAGSPPAP